jgi:hypothetical protein
MTLRQNGYAGSKSRPPKGQAAYLCDNVLCSHFTYRCWGVKPRDGTVVFRVQVTACNEPYLEHAPRVPVFPRRDKVVVTGTVGKKPALRFRTEGASS